MRTQSGTQSRAAMCLIFLHTCYLQTTHAHTYARINHEGSTTPSGHLSCWTTTPFNSTRHSPIAGRVGRTFLQVCACVGQHFPSFLAAYHTPLRLHSMRDDKFCVKKSFFLRLLLLLLLLFTLHFLDLLPLSAFICLLLSVNCIWHLAIKIAGFIRYKSEAAASQLSKVHRRAALLLSPS